MVVLVKHSLWFLGLSTALLGLACAGLEEDAGLKSPGEPSSEGASTEVSAFSLKIGDCFQDTVGETISDLPVVSCDSPHDNEVYHIFDVQLQGYDEAVVDETARTTCTDAFQAYVGRDFDNSKYYNAWMTPTKESWNLGSDREVICILYEAEQQMVGSARGTGL